MEGREISFTGNSICVTHKTRARFLAMGSFSLDIIMAHLEPGSVFVRFVTQLKQYQHQYMEVDMYLYSSGFLSLTIVDMLLEVTEVLYIILVLL